MTPSERGKWLEHATLVSAAERVMETTRRMLAARGRIDAFVLSWPARALQGDDGRIIDGPCLGSLESVPEGERRAAITAFAKRTNAYALLFIEQKGEALVEGSFEAPDGAEGWQVVLERHGDRWVPGPLVKRPGVLGLFRKN